jgi:hypothetical protein
MTEQEKIRWRIGTAVFRAMVTALEIPGASHEQIAAAFKLAAATLLTEPQIDDAPGIVPPQDSQWPIARSH